MSDKIWSCVFTILALAFGIVLAHEVRTGEPYAEIFSSVALIVLCLVMVWAHWTQPAREARAKEAKRTAVSNRLLAARRQYRHNNDNSPQLSPPARGFVYGYDGQMVDRLMDDILENRV